ncbi:MAG: type I restriction enzyme HsdR N-terminal domain-containing protein [Gammaproteobacteria bacterium]|nr:type I restriction enzyme HsdR N-terminal domain-containing protein [Gammaproteobacteria bacterium]
MKIPKKVVDRFVSTLKTYQAIAIAHKNRDVSEADTVTLIKDVLADVFGYNKYTELTSEQQIRGTYCDLAVKIDGQIKYLIEVKSAGVTLNDSHLRQAINYAANQGIEWVVLTNSIDWRLYRVKFAQPIDFDLVSAFDLPAINPRNADDQDKMFLLCREGITSDAMGAYHQHAQLFNKFTIAQLVMSEPVYSIVRRELRRLFPDLRVDVEQISDILVNDVLKREVIEGDKVKEAQQRIKKAAAKNTKIAAKARTENMGSSAPQPLAAADEQS